MRQDAAALRKRLKRTSKRIDERVPAPGAHSSETDPVVAKEAMATALKLSGELATPATLSRRTLHPYRLKVKDLRNVLKMATDADRSGFVTRLGEIKDAIGERHDWETLMAIARVASTVSTVTGRVRRADRARADPDRAALEASTAATAAGRDRSSPIAESCRRSRPIAHDPVCTAADRIGWRSTTRGKI